MYFRNILLLVLLLLLWVTLTHNNHLYPFHNMILILNNSAPYEWDASIMVLELTETL